MLSKEQIKQAGAKYGLSYEIVAAVASVESSGTGFNPITKFPTILFEGHIFSRLTGGKYDKTNPTISYPKWTKKFYAKTQQGEHKRFAEAIALDREAALKSTSYGLFQIMGFNYKECGCSSVQEFINLNCRSEADQLNLFLAFINSKGLVKFLKEKNWKAFAKEYNGPAFQINRYDVKLALAYDTFV